MDDSEPEIELTEIPQKRRIGISGILSSLGGILFLAAFFLPLFNTAAVFSDWEQEEISFLSIVFDHAVKIAGPVPVCGGVQLVRLCEELEHAGLVGLVVRVQEEVHLQVFQEGLNILKRLFQRLYLPALGVGLASAQVFLR